MPVKVTGAAALDRALAKVEADATDANVSRAAAALVVSAAKRHTRSRRVAATGRIRATRGRGWAIFGGPQVPWTAPSHFGHGSASDPRAQGGWMIANPFLFRGADEMEDQVIDLHLTRTVKAIREAGL